MTSPFFRSYLDRYFFLQDREKKVSKFELSGLSEAELQAQQEALFAASRARFEANQ